MKTLFTCEEEFCGQATHSKSKLFFCEDIALCLAQVPEHQLKMEALH